ncbi:hypothetical protein DMC30DRAFT_397521 [Rhodotorula diobovata]|uniref:Uncharacterized protein n=1 Tax=Rhodotorula diobovata TaxID=5288 RepID=A0A5C5FUX1_9BASI|nr:hypothetical protein DMC30DRAFT_397521 [Rhodotorula diobovata]
MQCVSDARVGTGERAGRATQWGTAGGTTWGTRQCRCGEGGCGTAKGSSKRKDGEEGRRTLQRTSPSPRTASSWFCALTAPARRRSSESIRLSARLDGDFARGESLAEGDRDRCAKGSGEAASQEDGVGEEDERTDEVGEVDATEEEEGDSAGVEGVEGRESAARERNDGERDDDDERSGRSPSSPNEAAKPSPRPRPSPTGGDDDDDE